MSDNTSDPASIESELDRTRSRLGGHLSELQGRLSPGQVLDDLMVYFRGSEGAAFGQSLLANVRGNPMPAALTGIGLAWLMASGSRSGSTRQTASQPEWERIGSTGPHVYGRDDYGATMARVRDAEQDTMRRSDEADHAYAARMDYVRGQALGLARHKQESTESFSHRIRDALAAVQGSITRSAHDLRGQAGSAASAAGGAASSIANPVGGAAQGAMQSVAGAVSQGRQTGGNLAATLAESPVILGALGLAGGALLGALLPRTEQEEAALGGIAGQARDAATSLAQEGLERGKQVAQAVMEQGRDSVQAQGLTSKTPGQLVDAALSGDLAGSAKTVIQDVLKTGDEAVRHGLESTGSPSGGQPAPPAKSLS